MTKKIQFIDFPWWSEFNQASEEPQNGGKMTGMDKLEFKGMEHAARNNEISSICVFYNRTIILAEIYICNQINSLVVCLNTSYYNV